MKQIHIFRTSMFILILISLTCSQLSCDSLEQGSVLYHILRKLKFRVTPISTAYPARLKRYDVLFLQDLDKAPIETEIREIQDFVRIGGTLIVSGGDQQAVEVLIREYGLKLRRLPNRLNFAQQVSADPFFPLHPVDKIFAQTHFVIESTTREPTVLYGTADAGVVVTVHDGEGRVFISTSASMFRADGLRDNNNATLLYNLMSTLPDKARIGLAEGRYYTHETKPPDPFVLIVFKTPGGLAALFVCLILFVFLTLRGRRVGKPLNVQESHRRLSSEYVHAMTTLYRKGNTRMEILRHIRNKFRNDLGNRWRVNPNLDTTTFLERLAQRGAVDEEGKLSNLLTDLESSGNLSEAQLLEIAKRVEAWKISGLK